MTIDICLLLGTQERQLNFEPAVVHTFFAYTSVTLKMYEIKFQD